MKTTGKTRYTRCQVEGCTGKVKPFIGLCDMHYRRMRRHGTTELKDRTRRCSVEGCENKHKARGLCRLHYHRQRDGSSGGGPGGYSGPPPLDATKVLRFVDTYGGIEQALDEFRVFDPRRREVARKIEARARKAGKITVIAADRLAVTAFGLHPMLILGDDWFQGLSDEEEPEREAA